MEDHVQQASEYWKSNLPFFNGVDQKARPSALFSEYFTKGLCKYGGRVSTREPMYKDRSLVDPNVQLWMSSRNVSWEFKHAMCVPTPGTGYVSLSKYEKSQPILDEEAWELACEWTEADYFPYCCNSSLITLEAAEAECNKQTSNGFPISKKYRLKHDFMFDDEGNLRDEYRFIQRRHFDDIATTLGARTFFTVSQKYEMRTRKKLAEGKIRTFTASSITHNMSMSQMCHDMNQKFYASHGKTMSVVGMSKYYGNWHSMILDLQRFTVGWALDESDYDSSFFRRQLWAQMKMRFNFLEQQFQTVENWNRLIHLYFDIIYTMMVTPQGDVICKDTGNPSGQNCTIVDNTQGLTRIFYYAYIKIWRSLFLSDLDRVKQIRIRRAQLARCPDPHEEDLLEEEMLILEDRQCSRLNFKRHVCAKMCGDDNSYSVADSWLGWFTGKAVAEVWTSIGVTTKSDAWEPRKVVDLDFLSHTTQYFPEFRRYLPVPEFEKTMDSLLFASTSIDIRWSLLRAFALRMESWPNLKSRGLIWDFISYCWKNHAKELVGSVNIPKGGSIPYEHILNVYMSDSELANLYCGFESTCSREVYDFIGGYLP